MHKIRILIVEDREHEANTLIAALEKNGIEVAKHANSLGKALVALQEEEFDLAIVDIYLGDHPEGIAFAEALNASKLKSRPFVFLTSSKDRAVFDRARLTKPYAFLMKPFNELEVLYAIEMALERFYEQTLDYTEGNDVGVIATDHLFIKKKGALVKVMLSSIDYVEVDERYCSLVSSNEKYVVMMSLSKMEELLRPHGFVRTHRKFLVQKARITQIILGEDTIILESGASVPLSDHYKGITKDLPII